MTAVGVNRLPAQEMHQGDGTDRDPTTALWVIALTAGIVASGMAFSLWWNPVVHHVSGVIQPGDFGATMQNAHVISRGGLPWVYSDHAHLVTLPGFPLLLAPVAWLVDILRLRQPWLLEGPFEMMTAAVALYGVDRLARALHQPRSGRLALLATEAVVIWPTLVFWGHPEDVVAVGLCALSLSAAIEGRWNTAAWLLGGALAIQLLALLLVPVLFAAAGLRLATRLAVRIGTLPGILAGIVLVADFPSAWPALTSQPNYPGLEHSTPWMMLSPSMGHGAVAAGPGRILGLLAAVACGVLAGRAVGDPQRLVWWAASALASRCLFEAVMDPYYVMPFLVVVLPLAFLALGRRSAVTCLAALALTVDTAGTAGIWTYWLRLALLTVVILAATYPAGNPISPGAPAARGLGSCG